MSGEIRICDISHKEYVPSSILALPLIQPSSLEENSDIRKCGQWLDIQLFGILRKPNNTLLPNVHQGKKYHVLFNIHCKAAGEGDVGW